MARHRWLACAALLAVTGCSEAHDERDASPAALLDAALLDAAGADADAAADAGAGEDDAGAFDAAVTLEDASAPEPPDPPEPPDLPDPPTGPVERTFRVLHWNVAGATIHRGRTDSGLVREVQQAIGAHNPHFVGLNELCRSQFDALVSALRASGWPEDPERFARFVASRPASTTPAACGAFGSAIFSRLSLGAADRFELPSDGTVEDRYLLCAPLRSLPHMRLCTTHLTPRIADGHNRAQLREVVRRLEAYRASGDTVLVTGDFNTEPDAASMDAVYAPGVDTPHNRNNTGEYRELDDADPAHCRGYGEATGQHSTGGACGNGRKIDFVFVRRDRIVRSYEYAADARPLLRECAASVGTLCSDHRMITGRVRVRIER